MLAAKGCVQRAADEPRNECAPQSVAAGEEAVQRNATRRQRLRGRERLRLYSSCARSLLARRFASPRRVVQRRWAMIVEAWLLAGWLAAEAAAEVADRRSRESLNLAPRSASQPRSNQQLSRTWRRMEGRGQRIAVAEWQAGSRRATVARRSRKRPNKASEAKLFKSIWRASLCTIAAAPDLLCILATFEQNIEIFAALMIDR